MLSCVREKFLVECYARNGYQSPSGKREDQKYILAKKSELFLE